MTNIYKQILILVIMIVIKQIMDMVSPRRMTCYTDMPKEGHNLILWVFLAEMNLV